MTFDWPNVLLGALLSIPIGWVFFLLAKPKGRVLAYEQKSQRVLDQTAAGKSKDAVTILYEGTPVERLNVTRILFWNAGDQTIDETCFVKADPLIVKVRGDGHIVDVEEIGAAALNVSTLWNDSAPGQADVRFDFLNPKHAFALRVLHSDNVPELVVQGTLRGAVMRSFSDEYNRSREFGVRGAREYGIGMVVLLAGFVVNAFVPRLLRKYELYDLASVVGAVSFVAVFAGLIIPEILRRRRLPPKIKY